MIDFDIQLVQSKRARELNLPGRPAALAIAQVMGRAVKTRMSQGRFVKNGTNWKGYASKTSKRQRGFHTNPFYFHTSPEKLKNGVSIWASSRHFHAGMGGRLSWASGGMWRGLTIYSNGINRASLRFMGRSLGYTVKVKRYKGRMERKTVDGVKVATGRRVGGRTKHVKNNVSNALKAWSVFRNTQVYVLEFSPDEYDHLEDFWAFYLQKVMDAVFSGQVDWSGGVSSPKGLAKELYDEFSRGGGDSPFRIE